MVTASHDADIESFIQRCIRSVDESLDNFPSSRTSSPGRRSHSPYPQTRCNRRRDPHLSLALRVTLRIDILRKQQVRLIMYSVAALQIHFILTLRIVTSLLSLSLRISGLSESGSAPSYLFFQGIPRHHRSRASFVSHMNDTVNPWPKFNIISDPLCSSPLSAPFRVSRPAFHPSGNPISRLPAPAAS